MTTTELTTLPLVHAHRVYNNCQNQKYYHSFFLIPGLIPDCLHLSANQLCFVISSEVLCRFRMRSFWSQSRIALFLKTSDWWGSQRATVVQQLTKCIPTSFLIETLLLKNKTWGCVLSAISKYCGFWSCNPYLHVQFFLYLYIHKQGDSLPPPPSAPDW